LTDIALIGASAASAPINDHVRSFAVQVNEWLAQKPKLARDLIVVYFGQNDTNGFNVNTPSVQLSETTHLYRDIGHFGRRGHQLICQLIWAGRVFRS
jgi:hypothetical protein